MVGVLYLPICPGMHHGGYTLLYICPGIHSWVHPATTLSGMVNVPVDTPSAATRPWAQEERIPWVRPYVRVNVVVPVMVGGSLCALLLRSSCNIG